MHCLDAIAEMITPARIISEDKPHFIGVSEILKRNTESTNNY